ncbi:MAG: ABC transporter permease [Lachnospiraceae bacterium]
MRGYLGRKQLGIPYILFLLLFVIAPLVVIIYYAFTNGDGHFTIHNFIGFFISGNTIGTLFYSLAISISTTVLCLLLAYPVAYILARSRLRRKAVLLALFIVPMWINFTLRILALKEILTVIEGNLAYYPFLNTVIGMTYDFLPFMILPLYTTLLKLDTSLLEAASDLGADPVSVFVGVTLPMSLPGIISGVMMVFLPSMTCYVVLDMLYNNTFIMGSLIGSYFNAFDWNSGSMISLILLLIIFFITWVTRGFSDTEADKRVVR